MKFGILISYKLNRLPASERCKIYRGLHGWRDKSQYGRYTYNRKGLLSGIPHVSVNRSVLIVGKEHRGEVISFLKTNKAKVFVRDVTLTKSDITRLSK